MLIFKSLLAAFFIQIGLLFANTFLLETDGKRKKASKKCLRFNASLVLVIYSVVTIVNKKIDFNNLQLGVFGPLYLVEGVMGSAIVILCGCYIRNLSNMVIKWCGINSLFLMVTHLPLGILPAMLIIAGKTKFLNAISPMYYLVTTLMIFILLIIEYFLNKIRIRLKSTIGKTLAFFRYI